MSKAIQATETFQAELISLDFEAEGGTAAVFVVADRDVRFRAGTYRITLESVAAGVGAGNPDSVVGGDPND